MEGTQTDPEVPTEIGRYRVLDVIGSGGMGVVCTAYDPKLDRKVALKILRGERALSARRKAVRRARLLREAQALAKLSHPNIVGVHDVDVHQGQVFMAMELVEGQSLDEWINLSCSSWRAVVHAFVAAGRGLAFMHDAGFTHRDFKPKNVLVGFDGRVRVVDFGLAKDLAKNLAREEPIGSEGLSASDADEFSGGRTDRERLTREGRVVGTPAYMAPEQQLAERVGPAADQFSFGVSLYEALYHQAPFGQGEQAFWRSIDGQIAEPPPDARVPVWLHRAIVRMLQPRVEDRFSSMHEALEAIDADPRRFRRGWMLIGATAMVMLGAGASSVASQQETPCRNADRRLGEVWHDEQRERIRSAFEATKASFASRTFERLENRLDRWGEGWVAARDDVCRRTHVHKEQSERLLDLRIACLDQQLVDVGSLLEVFHDADWHVVARAAEALRRLPDPAQCTSAEPGGRYALPEHEAGRARLERLRHELARVRAERATGRYQNLPGRLDDLLSRTREEGDPSLLVDTLLERAAVARVAGDPDGAEEDLREALLAAAQSGDVRSELTAAIGLIGLTGVDQGKFQHAMGLEMTARAAVRRSKDVPVSDRVLLELELGATFETAGKYDQARERLEEAVRLAEDGPDDDVLIRVVLEQELGIVAARTRDFDEAAERFEHSLELAEAELGEDHPRLSTLHHDLGNVYWAQGRLRQAREQYERARDGYVRAHGPNHFAAFALTISLGLVARSDGQWDDAAALFREAIEGLRAVGHADASLALAHEGLGTVLLAKGKTAEARDEFTTALELVSATFEPPHPERAKMHRYLCQTHLEDEDPATAREHADQALAMLDPGDSSTTQERFASLACMAGATWSLGDRPRAIEAAIEALTPWQRLMADGPAEASSLLWVELPLARVLWEAPGYAERAAMLYARVERAAAEASDPEVARRIRDRLERWSPPSTNGGQ